MFLLSEKWQVHRSHVASNKYRSLHRNLCNTWQLSQFTTQIDNKAHKNTKKLFLIFYQTVGVQHKFNIDYIQLSRLDFIHFILMHSQTSQFQFHAKINTQKYSNPIPSDFESMITHQISIPWILNKSNHALSSRVLRLLMNHVLSLDTSSIRHSISVLGSKDIFQHLKNHKSCMGGQTKASIKHGNQMLT